MTCSILPVATIKRPARYPQGRYNYETPDIHRHTGVSMYICTYIGTPPFKSTQALKFSIIRLRMFNFKSAKLVKSLLFLTNV